MQLGEQGVRSPAHLLHISLALRAGWGYKARGRLLVSLALRAKAKAKARDRDEDRDSVRTRTTQSGLRGHEITFSSPSRSSPPCWIEPSEDRSLPKYTRSICTRRDQSASVISSRRSITSEARLIGAHLGPTCGSFGADWGSFGVHVRLIRGSSGFVGAHMGSSGLIGAHQGSH